MFYCGNRGRTKLNPISDYDQVKPIASEFQRFVDQTENSGIGSDTQSQRQHCHESKAGAFIKLPKSIFDIVN